jgi:hypothetical protein
VACEGVLDAAAPGVIESHFVFLVSFSSRAPRGINSRLSYSSARLAVAPARLAAAPAWRPRLLLASPCLLAAAPCLPRRACSRLPARLDGLHYTTTPNHRRLWRWYKSLQQLTVRRYKSMPTDPICRCKWRRYKFIATDTTYADGYSVARFYTDGCCYNNRYNLCQRMVCCHNLVHANYKIQYIYLQWFTINITNNEHWIKLAHSSQFSFKPSKYSSTSFHKFTSNKA